MRLDHHHAILDSGLTTGIPLWRPKPFHNPNQLCWRKSHPNLFANVIRLSDADLHDLQHNSAALHALVAEHEPSFAPVAAAVREIDEPAAPQLGAISAAVGGTRTHVGIPGRKWQQIEGFASAIPKRRLPAIDYCAGKGYLSHRLLAYGAAESAHCLEIDPALCDTGRLLAERAGLPLTHHQTDVRRPLTETLLQAPALHVALHACGGLHRDVVRAAVAARAAQVAIAPCCYHKWPPKGEASSRFRPLSARVRDRTRLELEWNELRLAGVAQARKRRDENLRAREMTWRLAYAAGQRRATWRRATGDAESGGAVYDDDDESEEAAWACVTRLPSVPVKILAQGDSSRTSLDVSKG